jgi:hypothetical protein
MRANCPENEHHWKTWGPWSDWKEEGNEETRERARRCHDCQAVMTHEDTYTVITFSEPAPDVV